MKFATVCAALALFIHASAVEVRSHEALEHKQSTYISEECCLSQGGSLCGKVWKDCCRDGCQGGWFGSINCKNKVKLDTKCQNSCSNVCASKGGIVCTADYSSGDNIKCCPQATCSGSFSR